MCWIMSEPPNQTCNKTASQKEKKNVCLAQSFVGYGIKNIAQVKQYQLQMIGRGYSLKLKILEKQSY